MITITKVGETSYGKWCLFEYEDNNIIISGIAQTSLNNLEENKKYSNLVLKVIKKNDKIYYNILTK